MKPIGAGFIATSLGASASLYRRPADTIPAGLSGAHEKNADIVAMSLGIIAAIASWVGYTITSAIGSAPSTPTSF